MLHVYNTPGAVEFERYQLPLARMPAKAGRSRWKGVSHSQAIDRLVEAFADNGLHVRDESHLVYKHGSTLVSTLRFWTPQDLTPERAPRSDLCAGVVHDNGSRIAFQVAAGFQISLCANGICSGAATYKRKHTTGFHLRDQCRSFVAEYLGGIRLERERINRLWDRSVTNDEAEHYLLELGRQRILPWNRVGEATALWDEPPFEEFRERNAFCLYQAVNDPAKRIPTHRQARSLGRAFQLLESTLNLN